MHGRAVVSAMLDASYMHSKGVFTGKQSGSGQASCPQLRVSPSKIIDSISFPAHLTCSLLFLLAADTVPLPGGKELAPSWSSMGDRLMES